MMSESSHFMFPLDLLSSAPKPSYHKSPAPAAPFKFEKKKKKDKYHSLGALTVAANLLSPFVEC